MKTQQQEPKAQRYRAVAQFRDGREGLVVLGFSHGEVLENYGEAFLELYDKEQREQEIIGVQLQKWDGAADAGRWKPHKTLPIPKPLSMPIAVKRRVDELPIKTMAASPLK